MGGEPDSVDCPICGTSFDPDEAAGYCTNSECGEWQWTPEESTTDDNGEGDDASDAGGKITCSACGNSVPDTDFCVNCGESMNSSTEHRDEQNETTPPDTVIVKVGDQSISAGDGDTIGRKVRSAHVRSGGDEEQARLIHREHVRFERDGGKFYLVNKGRNGTKLNGEILSMDERQQIAEGDTVEFSAIATGEIQLQ